MNGQADALRAILEPVEALPSHMTGNHLSGCFKAQEAPARQLAETGEWMGRAALAHTLMGLAGYHLHGWASFGGTGGGDTARAASLYEEARSLYAGCTVDAESSDLCAWALQWAGIARQERDNAAAGGAQNRGCVMILPAGMPGTYPLPEASRFPHSIGS